MDGKPLELVLARNFLTNLSTAAFLVDVDGNLIFYNEAAGAMLGISFEESGRLDASEWGKVVGPFGEDEKPLALEELPTTKALRRGRPGHGQFKVRSMTGNAYEIEASAVPIVAGESQAGAMVFFWSNERDAGDG